MSINIYYNGDPLNCSKGVILKELIMQQVNDGEGFAVAINGDFVPRGDYGTTVLKQGDNIDVVSPVTGG